MGEYEPRDSRDVTQSTHRAPGEPPRTGPREDEARERAKEHAEGEDGKPTARNASGQKQDGYARDDVVPDESSVPIGK